MADNYDDDMLLPADDFGRRPVRQQPAPQFWAAAGRMLHDHVVARHDTVLREVMRRSAPDEDRISPAEANQQSTGF